MEQVTCKETLIASRTLHNCMVQIENTTLELLDAMRKLDIKENVFLEIVNLKNKLVSILISHVWLMSKKFMKNTF